LTNNYTSEIFDNTAVYLDLWETFMEMSVLQAGSKKEENQRQYGKMQYGNFSLFSSFTFLYSTV
jgi:hypothetical protein